MKSDDEIYEEAGKNIAALLRFAEPKKMEDAVKVVALAGRVIADVMSTQFGIRVKIEAMTGEKS